MNKIDLQLMTHVVAGYPSQKDCLELMTQMAACGVSAIEVQIPFSDPIADGPVIMQANSQALQDGVTTNDVFRLLSDFRQSGYDTPLFIMSYANKISSYGYEQFCRAASAVNISGIIIPDLPIGTDDYEQLCISAQKYGICVVPVLSPAMSVPRFKSYMDKQPRYVYVTSTRGITGGSLQIKRPLRNLVIKIRKNSDARIIIGFGVRSAGDIQALRGFSDAVVIGTALIKEIQRGGIERAVVYLQTISRSIQ